MVTRLKHREAKDERGILQNTYDRNKVLLTRKRVMRLPGIEPDVSISNDIP